MTNRLIPFLLCSSILTLSIASHPWRSEAVMIGRETPDTLSLTFSRFDSYPPGNSPSSNGPLVTLFSGQYWQVSAQSLIAPTGPAAGRSNLFVQQVIPEQNVLPNAAFDLSLRNTNPYTQQISYLANSPAQTFNQATCPLGSSNCVFYELQQVQDLSNPNIYESLSYQLQGSLKTSLQPVPTSTESTPLSTLAALSFMVVLQIKKRCFTESRPKDYSA